MLDGGPGTDTASYALATAGVTVSLANTGPQETFGAGVDTLVSIENLTGSPFADTLGGDNNPNLIIGGGGGDLLSGHAPGAINPTDANTFFYGAPSDSAPGTNSFDAISDFVPGLDKIDLTSLALSGSGPAQLTWLGAQGTDASAGVANSALAHAVWYYTPSAGVTYVYADVDGDGKADLKVQLNAVPLATDFGGVFVPPNTAPVLNANGGSLSYTENQAATAIDGALTVSDVDSATLTGATVSITANFAAGEDVLGFTNQNGITGSYNSGDRRADAERLVERGQLPGGAAFGDLLRHAATTRRRPTPDDQLPGRRRRRRHQPCQQCRHRHRRGHAGQRRAGAERERRLAELHREPGGDGDRRGADGIGRRQRQPRPARRCRSRPTSPSGEDVLGFTNQNGITGSYNARPAC